MASRENMEAGRLDDAQHWSKFKMMPMALTIGGTFTVDPGMPPIMLINPGAAGRTVLMPLATTATNKGLLFLIRHTGSTAATDLTIKDSTNSTTFGLVGKGQSAWLYCDGAVWLVFLQSDSATWNLDSGTASATAGAATLNAVAGIITSESITTAQNATYTLTLTNSFVAATDIIFTTLANGTNTQGTPIVVRVTPGSGSVVILVKNMHDAAQALNGTIKIGFVILTA